MNRITTTVVFATLAALWTTGSAYAACNNASVKGTYGAHFDGAERVGTARIERRSNYC